MSATTETVVRDLCPACETGGAEPLAELRDVPVQPTAFLETREEARAVARGDLVLAFCPGCGLVWNVAFDPDALEYDAAYESSLHFSPTFQRYAEQLADRLVTQYGIRNKTVVEIGSGKGEFLALVCAMGANRGIGYDPSYDGEVDQLADRDVEFVRDVYTPDSAPSEADLVVCRHVLEHIPDPAAFLASIRDAATNARTVFYIEVPAAEYLLRERAVWDLIYPHVTIFSEPALRGLFERSGFRVLRSGFAFGDQYVWVEASPTMTTPQGSGAASAELRALAGRFAAAVDRERAAWAQRLAASGPETIAVWGAGAKGTTFLNVVEGGADAGAVVDLNPRKQGRHVPGTGQRIAAPESLGERPPAHVLVMNPIYRSEIEQRLVELGIAPRVEVV